MSHSPRDLPAPDHGTVWMRRERRAQSEVALDAPEVMWETLRTVTEDGVLLAMDRYPRPGAPPVLLLHGWMQSPRGVDPNIPGHSLARFLSQAGFDVFIGCFRGHGHDRTRSGHRGAWSADEHSALDVPALVAEVRRRTRQRPTLVGHSLGGLSALLYLAGAHETEDGQIAADPVRAVARNREVRQVVAIAPPIGFPSRAIALFGERPDLAGRLLCALGASAWGQHVLASLPRIRLRRATRALINAPVVGRSFRRLILKAVGARFLRGPWVPENMPTEVLAHEVEHSLDATSGRELTQMASWVRNGGLWEHGGTDWRPALASVTVPTLLVAGAKDGISSMEGMIRSGFSTLGCEPLDLMMVEDAGHNDLRIGTSATHAVFPGVASWLHRHRRSRSRRTQPTTEAAL